LYNEKEGRRAFQAASVQSTAEQARCPGQDSLPPLTTITPFNGLVTSIHHHENAKLKLKRIASCEATVEHIQCMVEGDLFRHDVRDSIDPGYDYFPCSLPLIHIPKDIRGPNPPPTRHFHLQ
jgi:hypothetical protein